MKCRHMVNVCCRGCYSSFKNHVAAWRPAPRHSLVKLIELPKSHENSACQITAVNACEPDLRGPGCFDSAASPESAFHYSRVENHRRRFFQPGRPRAQATEEWARFRRDR